MHAEAYEWVRAHATAAQMSVLDIGGRNVNGSVRELFPGADPWHVLDILPGAGVDIVADATKWVSPRPYDMVVSTECLEHAAGWPSILDTAFMALVPGGRLLLTTAGPGRAPHSGVDGGALRPGEYYGNIDPLELYEVLDGIGFVDVVMDEQKTSHDVRCSAARPGAL
jgi:hypothetical protein